MLVLVNSQTLTFIDLWRRLPSGSTICFPSFCRWWEKTVDLFSWFRLNISTGHLESATKTICLRLQTWQNNISEMMLYSLPWIRQLFSSCAADHFRICLLLLKWFQVRIRVKFKIGSACRRHSWQVQTFENEHNPALYVLQALQPWLPNLSSTRSNFGAKMSLIRTRTMSSCKLLKVWTTLGIDTFLDFSVAYGLNASVSFHMTHGGTNFGYWNGAIDAYPVTTSYDSFAPIAEAGDVNGLFLAIRNWVSKIPGWKYPPTTIPANLPRTSYPDVQLSVFDTISGFIQGVNPECWSSPETPRTAEYIRNGYGYMYYNTVRLFVTAGKIRCQF